MLDILLTIITFGLKPVYDKNLSYYKIIKEFREKLPRKQNQAKNLTAEEIERHPLLDNSFKHIMVLDTSNHRTTIGETEIDLFYNKLNEFDYSFMFFKEYYKSYTRNLNRFNPKAENKNFDLIFLQRVIKDDPLHPIKPFDVFLYHLKWKYKLTSSIYSSLKYRKKKEKNF
ncbi:MAG: hypothetical protein V4547_06070 [Bacteroidota bacterium]